MKTRILLIFIVALVSLLLSSCAMSQERIEACFCENKGDLTIVKEFLADLEYPIIVLFPTEPHYQMWISGRGTVTIEDDEVVAAIGRLRENRYSVIRKRDNLVVFQRWATMDAGRGVLYSIDGSDPGEWTYRSTVNIIETSPLQESGWYYYVSNYALWNERYWQRQD